LKIFYLLLTYNPSKKKSRLKPFRRLLVPGFFTSLTTAIGFLSLASADFSVIRRFGVWAGFAALLFASFMAWIIVAMPPAADYENQAAIEAIFGATPRIACASLIAFCCGEFCNSYVLAKMKVWTKGRMLWSRTIGSTILGEAVDSLIFYPVAFLGVWDNALVLQVMLTNYTVKVVWEVVMTPVTYQIVGFLKRVEKEDYFDKDTNFTPFSLEA
jgi:uncharacterized integral membrane protein (TIGR00697 family)